MLFQHVLSVLLVCEELLLMRDELVSLSADVAPALPVKPTCTQVLLQVFHPFHRHIAIRLGTLLLQEPEHIVMVATGLT